MIYVSVFLPSLSISLPQRSTWDVWGKEQNCIRPARIFCWKRKNLNQQEWGLFLLKPIESPHCLDLPEGFSPIDDCLYTHPLLSHYYPIVLSHYLVHYGIPLSSNHHCFTILSISNIPIHCFKLGPKTKPGATNGNDSFRGNRFETLAIPDSKNV